MKEDTKIKKTMKCLFAHSLKMLRMDHRDRIEDLAKKSGVASSTISKYEQGTADMSIDKLEQIIAPYNISLYIFFLNTLAKTQEDVN